MQDMIVRASSQKEGGGGSEAMHWSNKLFCQTLVVLLVLLVGLQSVEQVLERVNEISKKQQVASCQPTGSSLRKIPTENGTKQSNSASSTDASNSNDVSDRMDDAKSPSTEQQTLNVPKNIKTAVSPMPVAKPMGYYYRDDPLAISKGIPFLGVTPRAFGRWPTNRTLPCFEAEANWGGPDAQHTPTNVGFVFLKPYKTGSSTASGVNIRVARNVARRQYAANAGNVTSHAQSPYELCKARFDHGRAHLLVPARDPARSFLWTIIRDPTARIVSQYFHFHVSRNKVEPNDRNFQKYVLEGPQLMLHDYYLYALSSNGFSRGRNNPATVANRIIAEYDFIGTTERMDESLVAMAILMGIPLGDMLYLKAKGHGGYDDGGGDHKTADKCTYIWPSFVTSGMRTFFETDEFQDRVKWDHAVYVAANRSLELTIEAIGRKYFAQQLELYQAAQVAAHDKCLPITRFPCDEGGVYSSTTDCLWCDSSCGNDCLDSVANAYGIGDNGKSSKNSQTPTKGSSTGGDDSVW